MIRRMFFDLVDKWRWAFLLSLLAFAMLLGASVGDTQLEHMLVLTLYAAIFAGTLQAAKVDVIPRRLGSGLIAVWFLTGLADSIADGGFDSPVFIVVTVLVLVGSLAVTISELARNRDAGLDPILGAVFGYLLIGVSWSLLYVQIEVDSPGSFNLPSDQKSSAEFLYYSLVTLTTLGYGEITPAAPIARLLAGFQAAFGTIYIAVFIGRIVGRFQD